MIPMNETDPCNCPQALALQTRLWEWMHWAAELLAELGVELPADGTEASEWARAELTRRFAADRAEVARLQSLLKYYTDKRAEYVRQQAPVILAGLAAAPLEGHSFSWDACRLDAIEQAGKLFDECGGT